MSGREEHARSDQANGGALDVFKVADRLISRALATHGDEIDIIGYYGSYAQGVAYATSDLDLFYIPADGKNPPIGRTLLVAGVLFDFWAITWHTMAGFATGHNRGWSFAPAIVHHAQVLHARSAVQAARFADLQHQVLELQKPEARTQMIQRALNEFKSVLAHVGNLRLAAAADDFATVRHAGWKVILSTVECLALANQVFFERGWGRILEQIPRLQSRPTDMEALVVTISTADDPALIVDAAERLALGARQVLREFQQSLPARQIAAAIFDSSYPEIKDGIGKVLTACERQAPVAASAAAWFIQSDLSLMLSALHSTSDNSDFNLYSEFALVYRQLGLPDLMQVAAADLPEMAEQARLLDDRVREWLRGQSVSLCEFATLAEFERSM